MTSVETTKWVTCPSCEQQFDEEIDGYDCLIKLKGCEHVVCISCSFDHIGKCREYWTAKGVARRMGMKRNSY